MTKFGRRSRCSVIGRPHRIVEPKRLHSQRRREPGQRFHGSRITIDSDVRPSQCARPCHRVRERLQRVEAPGAHPPGCQRAERVDRDEPGEVGGNRDRTGPLGNRRRDFFNCLVADRDEQQVGGGQMECRTRTGGRSGLSFDRETMPAISWPASEAAIAMDPPARPGPTIRRRIVHRCLTLRPRLVPGRNLQACSSPQLLGCDHRPVRVHFGLHRVVVVPSLPELRLPDPKSSSLRL